MDSGLIIVTVVMAAIVIWGFMKHLDGEQTEVEAEKNSEGHAARAGKILSGSSEGDAARAGKIPSGSNEGEYNYLECDQGWGARGTDCAKKVNQIIKTYFEAGWSLHSFNVIVVKGFILFEKQRYCFMFLKGK